MLTTAHLIAALGGGSIASPEAQQPITHAERDSRLVQPGALFVALPGERVDGHDFIADAFANGAQVALAQRDLALDVASIDLRDGVIDPDTPISYPLILRVANTTEALQQAARYWMQHSDATVIGITGSVGKSSSKELIHAVLSQRYTTLKNQGNLNNEIGLPLTVLGLNDTHQRAVLEMGFYVPGEIRFLCEIAPPTIGVVTNIGQVHAERAGSQDEIARGKQELVESLPVDGWALLNHDDPRVLAMAAHTPAQVLTYGQSPEADLVASEVAPRGLDGLDFMLSYQGHTERFRTPLVGRHAVYTALCAAGVGLVDGLTWDELHAGLHTADANLRMVVRHTASGALLLDDTYNASPQSTVAALDVLADLDAGDGRRIAVLGDMLELGPYEAEGHQRVGQHAAAIADLLVTVGRRAHTIAAAAREHGLAATRIIETEDIESAFAHLNDRIAPNDVLLVKGSNAVRMDRLIPLLVGQVEAQS